MRLPENTTQTVVNEVPGYLKAKISEAVDAGSAKRVIDLHEVKRLDMAVIKLLFQAMQTCRDLALQFTLVGNAQIVSECKGFEDTKGWQFLRFHRGRKTASATAPVPCGRLTHFDRESWTRDPRDEPRACDRHGVFLRHRCRER